MGWRSVVDLAARIRRGPTTVRGRRLLVAASSLLFVVLGIVAYRSLPPDRPPVRWGLIAVVFVVGGPAMLAVTSFEFRELARLCGVRLGWRTSVNVTVAATIANLLPVPGSVLVRTAHLLRGGAGRADVASAVGAFGLGFVGVGAAIAAVGFGVAGRAVAAGLAGLGSAAALVAVGLFCRRLRGQGVTTLGVTRVVQVEVLVLVVVCGRLWLVLAAIGAPNAAEGGMVLGSASALSTAIAIFPGGLGLREALSGLLGTVVGIDAAEGVLAAGVDRLTFLVALAVLVPLASIPWRPASAGAAGELGDRPVE